MFKNILTSDSVVEFEKKLLSKPSEYWQQRGAQATLRLFHHMAQRVPAYKDFLAAQNFSPSKVRTLDDLKLVPIIDKDNYLRSYPKRMLSWDGTYPVGSWTVSTTSGSTGTPFYFPRQEKQNKMYADTAELYLRSNFNLETKKTLYIVGFPMGAWIGGVFTYEALNLVAKKNKYNLTVITPGIHKQEIISAIKALAPDFDQVIIGAYAPFLKDIIDDGIAEGIDWQALDVGFVFSAEAFSETFRQYVLNVTDAQDYYRSTLNHYGTVDLGTMAHETPLSILIRKTAYENIELAKSILPDCQKQPTLAQYVPEQFYFEEVDDYNLLCSADAGLPLVRYNLKDFGGVIEHPALENKFAEQGYNLNELAKSEGVAHTASQLPFVYVYERNDLSISYYAFLIYPDTIRRSIYKSGLHASSLTGKFSARVDYDESGRQNLNIHVELRPTIPSDRLLKTHLTRLIHNSLMDEISEYRETYRTLGAIAKPRIVLHEYESKEYFKPGSKQKWVIKQK